MMWLHGSRSFVQAASCQAVPAQTMLDALVTSWFVQLVAGHDFSWMFPTVAVASAFDPHAASAHLMKQELRLWQCTKRPLTRQSELSILHPMECGVRLRHLDAVSFHRCAPAEQNLMSCRAAGGCSSEGMLTTHVGMDTNSISESAKKGRSCLLQGRDSEVTKSGLQAWWSSPTPWICDGELNDAKRSPIF